MSHTIWKYPIGGGLFRTATLMHAEDITRHVYQQMKRHA